MPSQLGFFIICVCIMSQKNTSFLSIGSDRRMRLKFDSFTSDWISVDNGIVQGDPLSMILYLFYNADLLEDMGKMETKVGYVDDVNFFAKGRTFNAAYAKLSDMMTREGGGQDWSKLHNSKFEM